MTREGPRALLQYASMGDTRYVFTSCLSPDQSLPIYNVQVLCYTRLPFLFFSAICSQYYSLLCDSFLCQLMPAPRSFVSYLLDLSSFSFSFLYLPVFSIVVFVHILFTRFESSSLVLCTYANPDQTTVTDNECDVLGAPLTDQPSGSVANVQCVQHSYYCRSEVQMSVQQIMHLTLPRRDMRRSHVKGLVLSAILLAFEYHNNMITATWSANCNLTKISAEFAIS